MSSEEGLINNIDRCKAELNQKFTEIDDDSLHLTASFYKALRNADRKVFDKFGRALEKLSYRREIQEKFTYPNRKSEKGLMHGLNNFSAYWNRNMVLFSLHLQADIYLIRFKTKVEKILRHIAVQAQQNYIDLAHENIEIGKNNINALNTLIAANDKDGIHQFSPVLLKDIYFNLEGEIHYVLEKLQDALDEIPEEVELLNARSVNQIRKAQGKTVETIKIQLDDITDYLTKIHFFKPFQDQMTNYIIQLKKGVALLLNSTYKIQQELDLIAQNESSGNLQSAIEAAESDLTESKEFIDSIHKGFGVEVNLIKTALNEALDINKIIEQYETLYPQAKLESRSKLRGRLVKYRSWLNKQTNDLVSKLIQRKQDVEVRDYNEKYQKVLSPVSIFRNFLNQIHIQPEVSERLPFYYHQLFTGKHFSDTQSVNNRKFEIAEAKKAIARIREGIPGGILILGESLSGKSFLASHVAHHLLDHAVIYRIKLLRQKSSTSNDLTKSFQNATGLQGSISTILGKINPKSTFIIEDIEKWWLNTDRGHHLINELSRILHTHGNSHYFILTANLFAYHTIKTQTTLGENIIGSILLNPLSNIENS